MSVQVFVHGFDGRPVRTNTILMGEIHVRVKKSEQRRAASHVVLDFYGRSKVLITRRREVNDFRYTHHNRFELEGPYPHPPRPTGRQTRMETFTYESKCLLFAHQHILSQSSFQAEDSRRSGDDNGTVIFPFELRIPTHSEPQPPPNLEAHNSNCFKPSGCFPGALGYTPPNKTALPQPLPDTMNDFDDGHTPNSRGTASVRYTLRATVPQLPGGGIKLFGLRGPADSTVDIPLFNPPPVPRSPIQYKRLGHQDSVRTFRLLPSHQTSRPSFRESMRSVFKKDSLPWFALGITFQAPELVWLDRPGDEPLPFAISVRRLAGGIGEATGPPPMPMPGVQRDEKGQPIDPAAAAALDEYATNNPDHVPNPQVFLKRLELKLVAHTALRGGHDKFSGYGYKRFEGITRATIYEFKASRSTPQLEIPVSDSSWLEIGKALGITVNHLRRAASDEGIGGITGEFLTPNIWRRWGVEWDIRLECADEQIRWVSDTVYGGGLGLQLWRGNGVRPNPQPGPHPAPPMASPPVPSTRADEGSAPPKLVVPDAGLAPPDQQQLGFDLQRGHTPIDPGRPLSASGTPGPDTDNSAWAEGPPAYEDVVRGGQASTAGEDHEAFSSEMAALDLEDDDERPQYLGVTGHQPMRMRRGSGVSELAGRLDEPTNEPRAHSDIGKESLNSSNLVDEQLHTSIDTTAQTSGDQDKGRGDEVSLNPWAAYLKK